MVLSIPQAALCSVCDDRVDLRNLENFEHQRFYRDVPAPPTRIASMTNSSRLDSVSTMMSIYANHAEADKCGLLRARSLINLAFV